MSLNKVFLIGNLTREPEIKTVGAGSALCKFGLAVNRRYNTAGGERREETCFVDVEMWGKRGEALARYFHKGDPILVEGRLKYDQWEAQDGSKRSRISVVAENWEFLPRNAGGGGGYSAQYEGPPQQQQQQQQGGGGDHFADQRGGGSYAPQQGYTPPTQPPIREDDVPF